MLASNSSGVHLALTLKPCSDTVPSPRSSQVSALSRCSCRLNMFMSCVCTLLRTCCRSVLQHSFRTCLDSLNHCLSTMGILSTSQVIMSWLCRSRPITGWFMCTK